MTRSPVTVVVLNWNGFEDTRRCVESLRRLDYPSLSIIVVDNGSTDDSAARIEAELPEVELIRSERNLGFAGGVNLGIRRALEGDAAYVWLLNNDATAEPGTLSALVDEAERDEHVGIVGGVLRDPSGRVEWGGGRINRWTGVSRPARPGRRLDYVSGACMLVRRAVFDEVGLFDEAFFFYFEDADLCARARQAGWRLAVAPEARVEHEVGASVKPAGWADRAQVASSGRFIGKHFGRRAGIAAALRLLGIAANRVRRGQARELPGLTRALLRGVRATREPAAPRAA